MSDTSTEAVERFTYSLHSLAQYEDLPDVDKEVYGEAITLLRALAAERDALRTHQDYDLEMLNSLLDYIERVEKTEHGMDGAVREIARRAAALRGPKFRSVRVRSRSALETHTNPPPKK